MASQIASQSKRLGSETIKTTYEIGGHMIEMDPDINTALVEAASLGHLDLVRMLVNIGADVNTKRQIGTPLTTASRNRHNRVVEHLCHHGAQLDLCDMNGISALSYAVMHGYTEIVKLLCHYGAKVNGRGRSEGSTVLHDAIMADKFEIVEALLEARASLDVRDSTSLTPLQLAEALRRSKIEMLLRERTAKKGGGLFSRIMTDYFKKSDPCKTSCDAAAYQSATNDVVLTRSYVSISNSQHKSSLGQSRPEPVKDAESRDTDQFNGYGEIDIDSGAYSLANSSFEISGQKSWQSSTEDAVTRDENRWTLGGATFTDISQRSSESVTDTSHSGATAAGRPMGISMTEKQLMQTIRNQQEHQTTTTSPGTMTSQRFQGDKTEGVSQTAHHRTESIRHAVSTADLKNPSADPQGSGQMVVTHMVITCSNFSPSLPDLRSLHIGKAINVAPNGTIIKEAGCCHSDGSDTEDD